MAVPRCHCGMPHAWPQLSPSAQDLFPEGETLCVQHLAELIQTPIRTARRAAHPAYAKFGHPVPTCYGDYGRCPNDGALYPGGAYCEEHRP